MSYDVAFRFQQALDPSALTTIPGALHGITAAIDDCRRAGKPTDSDPAVLLLVRHLGTLAANAGDSDSALRLACLGEISDMRRTCEVATAQRDGKFIKLAGLVLVRQKPGSAKGVMFITLEDESGVANLVIWPSLYEKQRRLILTASMMGVEGRLQREGEVVHVVVMRLHDLSGELAELGEREAPFPLSHGRGDEFHHGSVADAREKPPQRMMKARDIFIEPNHIDTLKVKARDFR